MMVAGGADDLLARLAARERLGAANGIELAYDEIGEPDGRPLILIMGLGTQLIHWDEDLCGLLAQRGYRVIRFDNRDVGHSTKLDTAGTPGTAAMLLGFRATAAYKLRDMAADTVGLMDHLGIEHAHVAGVSMGAMIAQSLAIRAPERVLSLCSIMSTTGNRRLGMPTRKALGMLLAAPPRQRDAYADHIVRAFRIIGSPGFPADEERVRTMALAAHDRCYYPPGVARQLHAVTASGDRTAHLRRLRVPTVVIHGDSDPLIRPAAGRATARAIPDARLRIVEGMGHDLPSQVWPVIVDEIEANAARAGGAQGASSEATAAATSAGAESIQR
jgi:pimeloyl-ACP methyl ester carboxylesterase